MAAPVLQFKRGNAGVAGTVPALRPGEPAISLNNFDFFIGIDTSVANNKFFGSHRYWEREDGTESLKLKLVDKDGANSINLKTPDTLSGIVTYTLPENIVDTYFLKTNSLGVLEWSNQFPNISVAGIATFTDTTDNTLGDADTGAVQIDGGLGVNQNVTVGGNLNVQGHSEFVGVVTFKGGTINLGDQDTDDINVAGEFISNLVPNTDDTYDIGVGDKRWRSANFSGISTFNNVTVGGASTALLVNGNARIVGVLTIGAASITFSGVNNQVTGITTFTGFTDFNEGINVDGHTELDNLAVSGVSTFTGAVDVNGGANISGGETILSSATVSDLTNNRIVIAGPSGSLEDSGNLTFDGSTLTVVGYADLDDVNVSSAATIATAVITNATITNTTFGSGTAITSVDTDLSTVSASDDTLASAKAIKTYVDAQITAQDLDIQADTGGALSIDLDSETLTISGTANEIETDGSGNTITIGLPDNVIIGAGLTVTGALDVNGGGTIDNIQIGVTDDNEIDTTSGNLTIDSAGGTVTIDDELIVSGDVRINGNDIKSSDGSTAITMSSTNVTVGGDLTVGGNDIKASDGTTALTLADSTGAVTAANDLTVQGNLYVSGNTTQVNTAALTVEDRTIDLGVVNGAAPASATTWDLGVLFNYHSGGSAKKSAVVWEHGDTRFKFASVLAADTNGSNNDTPQLTVTTFAPIEIGALWVNDCAGQSQVISCTGSERYLENITVDAGTF
jgi:hypothetical protein